MFAVVKTITDQFFKDLDKQPGWVPLLATIYTYIWFTHPFSILWDDINRRLGTYIEPPEELLAVLITALAYTLGDAIDTAIFKKKENGVRTIRFSHEGYKSAQREAQKDLGVEVGIYAISLKLATAAEKERRRRFIHFSNEVAKFLRGLAVALVFLAILWASQKKYFFTLIPVLEAVLLLPLYVILKFKHIQRLYELIPDLVKLEKPRGATSQTQPEKYFQVKDLDDIRLFFWDGEFVSAGKRAQTS